MGGQQRGRVQQSEDRTGEVSSWRFVVAILSGLMEMVDAGQARHREMLVHVPRSAMPVPLHGHVDDEDPSGTYDYLQ